MGKRLGCFLWVCLISCLLCANVQADEGQGGAASSSIEQVYLNMPEVTVYGYGLSNAGDPPEAYLGEEKLEFVSAEPFTGTGEGMEYYILLDTSNSMPDSYFSEIKDGIVSFCGEFSEQDRVNLITFGESVQVLAEGERSPEIIRALLSEVTNQDNRTLLFEAISRASDMAGGKSPDSARRRIVLVISDGEDVAVGRKMSKEALEELKEMGLPVYAMCIKDTARDNINSFGEFARMSGGDIKVFESSQAKSALADIRNYFLSGERLEFKAASNKASNRYERLSLHMPELEVPLNKEVFSYRWIPDLIPPELIQARQLEGRKIQVNFSEPVVNAETASNYSLRLGERVIPVSAVAQAEGDARSFIITAAEPLGEGEYTIVCTNITDHSQESNPLVKEYTLFLTDSDPEKEEEGDRSTLIIGSLAFAGVMVLLIAAIIIYQKVKKNRGVVFIEGKPVMASSVDVKRHIAIKEGEKKEFELLVTVSGKNPEKLELAIDRSLIVGRSHICDVYFDDNRMSRQHFALEWDGRDMYITDLDTTNGTSVNGVKLRERRKLEPGDRISAGDEELLIKW